MVSALFVNKDSVYKRLGIDSWDQDRDALNFTGSHAVICHPPCRAWGRLRHFAKPALGEKDLALFALSLVRKNGGILEHPRSSKLWEYINLYGFDNYGGYAIHINQHWFGFPAEKKTILYIVGLPSKRLPLIPLNFDVVRFTICSSKSRFETGKKELNKKNNAETPSQLASWLIEVCELINENKVVRIVDKNLNQSI